MFLRDFVKSSLKCFLTLKTSDDNDNSDQAIGMQEKGCSDFVRHVIDVDSMFLLD